MELPARVQDGKPLLRGDFLPSRTALSCALLSFPLKGPVGKTKHALLWRQESLFLISNLALNHTYSSAKWRLWGQVRVVSGKLSEIQCFSQYKRIKPLQGSNWTWSRNYHSVQVSQSLLPEDSYSLKEKTSTPGIRVYCGLTLSPSVTLCGLI